MIYKEVKCIYGSGPYNDISVDGQSAVYDVLVGSNCTRFYLIGGSWMVLKTRLPLNKNNPKETLDKFFKLLLLQ
jgi:hypothetical protein